jgi:hypothetical protein
VYFFNAFEKESVTVHGFPAKSRTESGIQEL